ncbi:MAG: FAD:protein FMN transferase [Candidatus Saccharibacteria bacterium]
MIKTHTRIIMGMPVILQLPTGTAENLINEVFARLTEIDEAYSTYIATSEVSRIQSSELPIEKASEELLSILDLAAYAKTVTKGYFDVHHKDVFDPSGIIKGWAIAQAAKLLDNAEIDDYIVEIAGDMYVSGYFEVGKAWTVGIRAPHEPAKIVKIAMLTDMAIATSGTSERGQHIYNPKVDQPIEDVLSISVIGPDIIWADIYATAAFAQGAAGIEWLETLPDYEGFAILPDMTGISTSGLGAYVV